MRRDPDGEAGPLARSGLDLDGPVVLLDDPVADREPQPGPLAQRLGGEERVEDPIADRRIDAAAGVGDLDPDPLAPGIGPGPDRDRAAIAAGVDGVHQQVDYDLVEPRGAAADGGQGGELRLDLD